MQTLQDDGTVTYAGLAGETSMPPLLVDARSHQGGNGIDAVSEETIRLKAYGLYQARGCIDGHDQEDWLEAESQLRGAHPLTTE